MLCYATVYTMKSRCVAIRSIILNILDSYIEFSRRWDWDWDWYRRKMFNVRRETIRVVDDSC
jgi:hypothetical protein